MLPLSQYFAFEWGIVGLYVAGFAVASPPLAWGGLAVGWWLNRGQPLAPRLAGALLAAVVGAYVVMCWLDVVNQRPLADTQTRLAFLGEVVIAPFQFIRSGGLHGAVICALFYLPALLALLLYVVARRYEEGLGEWLRRTRERHAETRQMRAEKQAARRQARAERHALVPVADAPAAGGAVLTARSGEAVALPADLVMAGEARPGFIVIHVTPPAAAPPVVLPRYGRGYIVGTCIAVYYLAATVSKLWLPLLAAWLWFFGPSLLASGESQLADMIARALSHIKIW